MEYSLFEKLLQELVFKFKFINNSLFEIEKRIYIKKDFSNLNHVFISGLPRSGSTSILNFLYSSNLFGSLKYLHMPFLLSPNLSKKLKKKEIKNFERYHGDGIYFSLDSPESFDEVFFKNSGYLIKNELANFINLILNCENKKLYLSKNNNNLTRINLIKSILPNSIFIIPIREPIQQSYSLFNQHQNFLKLQKKDNFMIKYMNYLGHNEFGYNHIPWSKPNLYTNPNNINYWLEQWIMFYKNVFKNHYRIKRNYVVKYESLVSKNYLNYFLSELGLNKDLFKNTSFFINNKRQINLDYDQNLMNDAKNLYYKYTE